MASFNLQNLLREFSKTSPNVSFLNLAIGLASKEFIQIVFRQSQPKCGKNLKILLITVSHMTLIYEIFDVISVYFEKSTYSVNYNKPLVFQISS